MNTFPRKDNTAKSSASLKPVRHIVIAGTSAKSCRKLKLLLKYTNYYCLVDCYKNSNELLQKETFHLPDCVIMEVKSLYSLFSINKKIDALKEAFPGIKPVLYYNMLRRYPLLELRNREFPGLHSKDDELNQVYQLEKILKAKL